MINHAVLIILLKTLLMFIKYPTESLAMDFNYPIRNMSVFITESSLQQFTSNDRGNYTQIVNLPNYIYIVSNGNELLKIARSTMKVMDTFSGKLQCAEKDYCDQRNINLVKMNKENNIMWFCFAIVSISNNVYKEEVPVCYLTLEDSLTKIQGQWQAQTFTSSDFQHRTVSLTVSHFIYVGLHYYFDKQLHIFKNAVTYANSNVPLKVVGLPQNFLKAPGEFILTFQNKNSIYFLLLETDFSCGFRNNQLQTRLLRICNDDIGTSNIGTANNEFNALAKIVVNCVTKSGQSNFVFHTFTVASAATWMSLSNSLAVSFISTKNEASSSVICIYSLKSIEDAFNSEIKRSDKPSYNRNDFPDTCNNFSTNVLNNQYLSNIYAISKIYPLRKKVLSNVTIFQEPDSTILHISSDESVWSKFKRVILFLGVEYARQSAVITISLEPKFCILDKLLIQEKITMLELNRDDKSVLYIGTSSKLIILPMDRCNNYKSEETCAAFLNPYCGWSKEFKFCSYISKESELNFFSQTVNICPKAPKYTDEINSKLDVTCPLISTSDPLKQIGACTCRLIKAGPDRIVITTSKFCKVDGEWSPFSEWSDCSVTCDSGVQTRSRNCDNPYPRSEGNKCKGLKLEMRACKTNIECKKKIDIEIQGAQFSQWSSWSPCSNTCGFSFKTRTRNCLSGDCGANPTERKLCTFPLCKSLITSEWSNWSKFSQLDLSKRRLRGHCQATYFYQQSSMTIGILEGGNQTRACTNDQCFEKNVKRGLSGSLTLWSSWSHCSASCGVGIKVRSRQCSDDSCLGSTTDVMRCNIEPCQSTWSCWSTWNGCSSLCETPKIKKRHRYCMKDLIRIACIGSSIEEKECDLIPCTSSYSQWSIWSSCRTDGVMVRTRKCNSKRHCLLPLLQSKPCARPNTEKPALYNSIYMIVSGIVGLFGGVLVGSIICYIWWRCTLAVIRKTNSGSLPLNNPYQMGDVNTSQSLNTLTDTGSNIYRQRSTSNSDSYFQAGFIPQYRDDSMYSLPPTFFDYRTQPLSEVEEL